jgi:exosortase
MTPAPAAARPLLRTPAVPLIWYSLLLAAAFAPVIYHMMYQWQNDDDMSHGFFVPLIAGYIIWERQSALPPLFRKRHPWALALVAIGMLQLWLGTAGAEIFLQRIAFLVSGAGVLAFYGGARALRTLALPLFLLAFMIPLPGLVYKQITFPLQLLASGMAERILEALGYMVVRDGNVLELAGQSLSVVEACSGLRALASLCFFSLSYAYLFDNRPWMKWVLLACTPPVAIAANSLRIVTTGVLGNYDRELAEGIYHTISGWTLFVVALTLLIIINRVVGTIADRMQAGGLSAHAEAAHG